MGNVSVCICSFLWCLCKFRCGHCKHRSSIRPHLGTIDCRWPSGSHAGRRIDTIRAYSGTFPCIDWTICAPHIRRCLHTCDCLRSNGSQFRTHSDTSPNSWCNAVNKVPQSQHIRRCQCMPFRHFRVAWNPPCIRTDTNRPYSCSQNCPGRPRYGYRMRKKKYSQDPIPM